MIKYFDVILSSEVETFLDSLDNNTRKKILHNVDKSRFHIDPRRFKKLTKEIWEFKTRYGSKQYRLFAKTILKNKPIIIRSRPELTQPSVVLTP